MNKKKSTKISKKINFFNEHSILYWVLIIFIVLFLFIVPFNKALFDGGTWQFEGPIYKAFLWSSVVLLVMAIYLYRISKEKFNTDWLSLAVWLIPTSYLISSYHAASNHSALNSVFIYSMYASFYVFGLHLTRSKVGLKVVVHTLIYSGYVVVIYGLMNWFGNVKYQEAILYGRLSNTFQYPNTYAAFLIGLLFSSMLIASNSKKRHVTLLHASMSLPIILSFLLTSSRGGMVLFPVILIIYITFHTSIKQILCMIHLLVCGFISLLILTRVTNIGTQLREEYQISLSVQGWLIVIICSLFVTVFVLLAERYVSIWLDNKLQIVNQLRLMRYIIPVGLLVIFLLGIYVLLESSFIQSFLPEMLKNRILDFNNQDNSLISRSAFYKDSLEIIKDYPIFGAGGGAWTSLYQVHQSYVYTSRQAHNFFLQYLVETGLFGFVILVGFIIYVVISFVKKYKRKMDSDWRESLVLFIMMSAILIHSLIDFDMSYVYMGILVFLCLGGMSASFNEPVSSTSTSSRKTNIIISGVLSVISLFMMFFSYRVVQANIMFVSAANDTSGDYYQISAKIDKAMKYAPNHPLYVSTKASLLNQAYNQTKQTEYYTEAQKLLSDLALREPYSRAILSQQYVLYESKGDRDKSLETILAELKIAPWDISLYEKAASLLYEFGYQAKQEGLEDKAKKYWEQAEEIYREVLKRREQANNFPEYQKAVSSGFKVTEQLALSIGQIYFMKGEYDLAAKTIDSGRTSNDFNIELHRITAYWYLASIRKQGKDNAWLYEALKKYDPEEVKQVEEIMNMTP